MSNFNGLSGHVQFDEVTGRRTNLSFSLVDKIGNSIDIVSCLSKLPSKNKSNSIFELLKKLVWLLER